MGNFIVGKKGQLQHALVGDCWHGEAVGGLPRKGASMTLVRGTYLLSPTFPSLELGTKLGKLSLTDQVAAIWDW